MAIIDTTGGDLGSGGGLGGMPSPTGDGDYLSYSGMLTSAAGFPEIGAVLSAIGFIINWVEWFAGLFEGVPHEAKTTGLGTQLLRHPDPVTAFLGANLISGAKADRVISESTGAHSFEAITGTLAQELYLLQNQYPFGIYWQSIIDGFGRPAWQLKGVPPPNGAPYTEPVDFVGIQILLSGPSAYAALYGSPPPTPEMMLKFLNSGLVPTWRQFATGANDFVALRKLIGDAVKSAWQTFIRAEGGGGGGGGGAGDSWVDNPEDDELVNGLNHLISLLRQASGGGNPDPVTCAQVTSAAGVLGDALAKISDALGQLGGEGRAAVDITPVVGALTALADEVASISATAGHSSDILGAMRVCVCKLADELTNVDLAGVVEQLKRIADAATAPAPAPTNRLKALCDYLDANGLGDPALSQVLLS